LKIASLRALHFPFGTGASWLRIPLKVKFGPSRKNHASSVKKYRADFRRALESIHRILRIRFAEEYYMGLLLKDSAPKKSASRIGD
jgi:hypothetical protein